MDLEGLVAHSQSVMSATDTLGHRDVRGLSATDPRLTVDLRPHYAQGCWHAVITSVGNRPPHVCAWG